MTRQLRGVVRVCGTMHRTFPGREDGKTPTLAPPVPLSVLQGFRRAEPEASAEA